MTKTFETFLLESNVPKLYDIEDIVWTDGVLGIQQALYTVNLLIDYLKGKKLRSPVVEKFDAIPTILAGIFHYDSLLFDENGQVVNPQEDNYLLLDHDGNIQFDEDDGTIIRSDESIKNKFKTVSVKTRRKFIQDSFFIGTRAIFTKNPKLLFSLEDINALYDSSDQLNEKLQVVFESLKELPIKNKILLGDVLFTQNDLQQEMINNEDNLLFRSNTILYGIPESNKDLYEKIKKAKLGIHFYGGYQGVFRWVAIRDKDSGKIKAIRPSANWLSLTHHIDISELEHSESVFCDTQALKTLKGKHDRKKISDRTLIDIENLTQDLTLLYNKIKDSRRIKEIFDNANVLKIMEDFTRYISNRATGNKITDQLNFEVLIKFVISGTKRRVNTSKKKETKKSKLEFGKNIIAFLKEKKSDIQKLFEVQQKLESLKLIILNALEKNKLELNAFIKTKHGLMFQTFPAHYIVPISKTTAVRLSDRSAYTHHVESEIENDTFNKQTLHRIDDIKDEN